MSDRDQLLSDFQIEEFLNECAQAHEVFLNSQDIPSEPIDIEIDYEDGELILRGVKTL